MKRVFAAFGSGVILGALMLTGMYAAHAAPKPDTAEPAARQPAFVKIVVEQKPFWSDSPLELAIRPDEKLCRQKYKGNWEEACTLSFGRNGEPAEGVSISPAMPGVWRWNYGSGLTFIPEKPWPADTEYTISLEKLSLPARAELGVKSVRVSTPKLAAFAEKGDVWIDPRSDGERAVSFVLRFTSPPVRSVVEKSLTLAPENASLALHTPEFVWMSDTQCLVKTRVRQLAEQDTGISLKLPKVRAISNVDGNFQLAKGNLTQRVVMPGTAALFKVREAALETATSPGLHTEFRLILRTSLRVTPEEALRKLKIVQLPVLQNPEATTAYKWTDAPTVAPADLNRGTALTAELVSDPALGDALVFRVPVLPGNFVFCELPAGFGPQKGLAEPWRGVFYAAPPEPEVRFLQPGNVLALGGEHKLHIMAKGVTHATWRAGRVLRSGMNVFFGSGEPFTQYEEAWTEIDQSVDAVHGNLELSPAEDPTRPRFATLDVDALTRNATGLMWVELLGYNQQEEIVRTRRLVLATDLGMVVKKAVDDGRDVFVCSLTTGKPVSGARVEIIGKNGLPVASAQTDAQGKASLPPVRGLEREKTPVAVVASVQTSGDPAGKEDLTWMSLDDMTRNVDYSRFAISGKTTAPNGINAYVFSQRGLYRPGETLHFGVILRRGDWKSLPADMPFAATLYDPAERVVMSRTFTGADSLTTQRWTASESAPTGRYRLEITTPTARTGASDTAGSLETADSSLVLGVGTVMVEEFQPDTLAIKVRVPEAGKGWLVTPDNTASAVVRVDLRNLYGLPAVERKVTGRFTAGKIESLAFPGYESFTFPNILPWQGDPLAADLPEGRTDDKGLAALPLGLHQFRNGTLQFDVQVSGFEPDGGRAVDSSTRFLLSPLTRMLGYRADGAVGNLNFVPMNAEGGLEFVAVDPDLNRVNSGPLNFVVMERRYVTSLVAYPNGRYGYEQTPVDKPVQTTTVSLGADRPYFWQLPTQQPGDFLLSVHDADNAVLARVPFTVAGNDDLRPALTRADEKLPSTELRVRLDKTDYAPGDTVQLFLSAPYEGAGLITLERDTVAAHQWFSAKAGNSVHSFVIPKDFEGRGYLNISMGRALSSPDIFIQPHSYAVASLNVNVAARDQQVKLERDPAPTVPGTPLKVRVSAAKPGKVVVFAVDEGVLQLTRFVTPDPLRALLLDRALSVDTSQLFDLVMPDPAQIARRIPAFGGGLDRQGGLFNNPFKRKNEPPLTWWSDVLDVGPEGRELSIPVPDYYNGQVRLMAVAASADSAGNAQAEAVVRGEVVVTPQAPQFVAPGDVFTAAVAVANTRNQPFTLTVKLDVSPGLVVQPAADGQENLPETLILPAGAEVVLPVTFKASDTLGNATFTLTLAQDNGFTVRRSASLSVRPASALRQSRSGGATRAAINLPVERVIYPHQAASGVSVSAAPLPALRGLLAYLRTYPHGCVEQRISRSLPLLALAQKPVLAEALRTGPESAEEARALERDTLDAALNALRGALRQDAGVALWPDSGEVDLLVTAYAGDYLLAVREAGFAVPGDLDTGFFTALLNSADSTPQSLADARRQAYALWVLTRMGQITASSLEQLTAYLDENHEGWHTDITATLMAGSYAVMHMDAQASTLVREGLDSTRLLGSRSPLDATAAEALRVAVLARHFPYLLDAEAETLSTRLLERLNQPYGVSTFAAAQAARALLLLTAVSNGEPVDGVTLQCTRMQPGFAVMPEPTEPAWQQGMLSLEIPGCAAFSVGVPENKTVFWEVNTQGYDRAVPDKPHVQGLEVTRRYSTEDGQELKPGDAVSQGSVLAVTLGLRVFGDSASQAVPTTAVVLSDLFPGGFELVLEHAADTPSSVAGRVERREDRFVLHASVGTEPLEWVYHLRAVSRGTFTVPAAQAEGMYDRSLIGHTAGGAIVVQ